MWLHHDREEDHPGRWKGWNQITTTTTTTTATATTTKVEQHNRSNTRSTRIRTASLATTRKERKEKADALPKERKYPDAGGTFEKQEENRIARDTLTKKEYIEILWH